MEGIETNSADPRTEEADRGGRPPDRPPRSPEQGEKPVSRSEVRSRMEETRGQRRSFIETYLDLGTDDDRMTMKNSSGNRKKAKAA